MRRRRALPDPIPKFVEFGGGLDLITPPYKAAPGSLRDAINFEIGINEGYDRIQGYERFDGRPSPSDAQYSILDVTITGSISVGDSVVGVTSGETGEVIAIASDSSYLVLTKVTGQFSSGETLNVSGSPEATTTSVSRVSGGSSSLLHSTYKNLAADVYRDDIQAVPGSGSIQGVWRLNDVTYAFRNNAGGTATDMYKSTSSGWSKVDLGYELAFTSGGTTEITEGQIIEGATSGAQATVTRVMLESGSWAAGTAAGKFIFASQTGTFQSENIDIVAGGTNLATIAGDSSAITLSIDGRYEFVNHAFSAGDERMYGVNRVDRGFEFDGTVFCPITTGMATDTPNHVFVHKEHLFFSFAGSSQHSGIGTPYSWSVITGAAELAIGSTVTGYTTEGGSELGAALAIWARNSIHILYGSSSADWQLSRYRDEVGGYAHSMQQVGSSYALDDRGILSLRAAEVFGNFNHSTISQLIQPWIVARKPKINASCIVRDKSQYRLFFSDRYALYVTFQRGKLVGMMPVLFNDVVECCFSLEANDGSEVIMFGSDDGFVYQMEKGTSLDGEDILAYLHTHYFHAGSPRRDKSWEDCTLEFKGEGYHEIYFGYSLSYSTTDIPQPSDVLGEIPFFPAFWDVGTWDSGVWDGRVLAPATFDMGGEGENVSLMIRSQSDYFETVKISGALLHFLYRQRLRY